MGHLILDEARRRQEDLRRAAIREEARRVLQGARSEYRVHPFLWALLCQRVNEGPSIGECRRVWLYGVGFPEPFGWSLDTNGAGLASGVSATATGAALDALAAARRVWKAPTPPGLVPASDEDRAATMLDRVFIDDLGRLRTLPGAVIDLAGPVL